MSEVVLLPSPGCLWNRSMSTGESKDEAAFKSTNETLSMITGTLC